MSTDKDGCNYLEKNVRKTRRKFSIGPKPQRCKTNEQSNSRFVNLVRQTHKKLEICRH